MSIKQAHRKHSNLAEKRINQEATQAVNLPKVRNLTKQVVISEVKEMLASPAYLPYRRLLISRSLESWLVQYAMRRINSFYIVVNHPESVKPSDLSTLALIQKPKVRRVLHAGIQLLVKSCKEPRSGFQSYAVG